MSLFVKSKLAPTLAISSTVGIVALINQINDLTAARDSSTLICDINNTVNCSAISSAWQSSVFGFPNSLVSLVFFSMILALSIMLLSKTKPSSATYLFFVATSYFFIVFGAWYFLQSIYVVQSICIYCAFVYVLLLANTVLLGRLAPSNSNVPYLRSYKTLITDKSYDIFITALIAALLIGSYILVLG
jgi:uncharacterized membrane protein